MSVSFLELQRGFVILGKVVSQEVIAIRLHGSQNGAIQSGIFHLHRKLSETVSGRRQPRLTSINLSPGRSLNLNKSYALAHISASGNISNDSIAVIPCLFG